MRDLGLNGRNGLERTGVIKSVQRGTISVAGATSVTATITAVDLNNSIIHYLGDTQSDPAELQATHWLSRIELTNATTVTGYCIAGNTFNTQTISWEVIEFYPGIIKSVQRGATDMGGSTSNSITITAVNMNRTHLDFLGFTSTYSANPYGNTSRGKVVLTNSTTVTATVANGSNGAGAILGYQVVEWF